MWGCSCWCWLIHLLNQIGDNYFNFFWFDQCSLLFPNSFFFFFFSFEFALNFFFPATSRFTSCFLILLLGFQFRKFVIRPTRFSKEVILRARPLSQENSIFSKPHKEKRFMDDFFPEPRFQKNNKKKKSNKKNKNKKKRTPNQAKNH